jgi:hypothetical protein
MVFDIPHMIATAIIVMVAIWLVNNTRIGENATKVKRAFYLFLTIFVPLFILNTIWPYGSGL